MLGAEWQLAWKRRVGAWVIPIELLICQNIAPIIENLRFFFLLFVFIASVCLYYFMFFGSFSLLKMRCKKYAASCFKLIIDAFVRKPSAVQTSR